MGLDILSGGHFVNRDTEVTGVGNSSDLAETRNGNRCHGN